MLRALTGHTPKLGARLLIVHAESVGNASALAKVMLSGNCATFTFGHRRSHFHPVLNVCAVSFSLAPRLDARYWPALVGRTFAFVRTAVSRD